MPTSVAGLCVHPVDSKTPENDRRMQPEGSWRRKPGKMSRYSPFMAFFVSNRAFFFAMPAAGQGIHAFTFEVSSEHLRKRTAEGYWKLEPVGKAELDSLLFMPWRVAVARCPDALALAAIARLIAMRKDLP